MSNEVSHALRAHSEIGASSSERWVNCPASVRDSRGIEDKKESFYAKEGSCAHECSEYCLENDVEAEECIGMEFNGHTVDEEMAKHVQFYLDKMRVFMTDDYDYSIEEKFTLKQIHENAFGSNDFCAMGLENGELVIADFKYGQGINVNAKDNLQLVYYALGAYFDANAIYDFKVVRMIVVQPRFEGGEYDEWVITIEELERYIDVFKHAVSRVYSDDPEYKIGDHCRFCKAKPNCPAMKEKTEELIDSKFSDIEVSKTPSLPDVHKMSKEQLAKVLTHKKVIEDWMKSVTEHAHELVQKGEEIPGFKLVKARSNKKIKSEEDVIEQFEPTFGEDIYRPKQLKTMTDLKKLVGAKELEPFLVKPDKGTQIAPITDKRPEVPNNKELADEAFDEIDEINERREDFENMEF